MGTPGLPKRLVLVVCNFNRKYSLKEIAHLVQGFDLGKQRQITNTAYLFNIRRSERDCNRHCVRRTNGWTQGRRLRHLHVQNGSVGH